MTRCLAVDTCLVSRERVNLNISVLPDFMKLRKLIGNYLEPCAIHLDETQVFFSLLHQNMWKVSWMFLDNLRWNIEFIWHCIWMWSFAQVRSRGYAKISWGNSIGVYTWSFDQLFSPAFGWGVKCPTGNDSKISDCTPQQSCCYESLLMLKRVGYSK